MLVRYSLRSSRWCSNSVEEFMKYSKEVRSGWARNHGRNDPFTSATTWKSIPSHPEGCHLLDISGTISDKNMYKEINDKLLNIKKETGVEVLVYMFGDMQSRLPVELTKRLGHYYLENNTKYENGNFIIIMTSRSTGAVGMYAAPAVKHIIHPLWLRNTHKKLNTNTQWNTKMNPYISTLHDRLIAKKGIIFNNKLIVSVYDYWWALLLGAAVLIKGISFLYQYWSYWGERYCSVHGQYLLGDDNPKIVYEHLTDGQKAEVDSDCVTYAVWRCPSENCTTDKVDEVHWNYLRNDCLICLKCRHRTSQAARIISTRPDEDNFGEALNHRTCRFCKYEEAWLTMMPANYGGWKDPEHDKDLQGNYGSQWWIKFKMSILGHLLMGSSGPQGEVRRGGVGMLSNKDGVYSPPSH